MQQNFAASVQNSINHRYHTIKTIAKLLNASHSTNSNRNCCLNDFKYAFKRANKFIHHPWKISFIFTKHTYTHPNSYVCICETKCMCACSIVEAVLVQRAAATLHNCRLSGSYNTTNTVEQWMTNISNILHVYRYICIYYVYTYVH